MATTQDLARALAPEELAGLADDDGDGTADAAVLSAALAAAEREVRARSGVAEGTDLSGWQEDAVVTLAVERLFERRRGALPPVWAIRAERARQALGDGPGRSASGSAECTRDPEDRQTRPETLGRF